MGEERGRLKYVPWGLILRSAHRQRLAELVKIHWRDGAIDQYTETMSVIPDLPEVQAARPDQGGLRRKLSSARQTGCARLPGSSRAH